MPEPCPPSDAEDGPCVVYRAVENDPISDTDLESWVKSGHPSAKVTDCKHWGISVWTSIEAAEHAREIVPHMLDKYVAKGCLIQGDGKVGATPTKRQPLHCTLWVNTEIDLKPRFTVVMEPDNG